MKLRHTSLAAALIVVFASVGDAQTLPATPRLDTPDFQMQVWSDAVADFNMRVQSYYELRSRLERELPPLTPTADLEEIRRVQFALAKAIRAARSEAREGEIFTRPTSVEFKRVLLLTMNANTYAVLMDDNPGEFRHKINGRYPEGKPFSTVPPDILALLPQLPDAIQFRFLGRHLVLYDVRANVILDRIHHAIRCTDCDS